MGGWHVCGNRSSQAGEDLAQHFFRLLADALAIKLFEEMKAPCEFRLAI
jgi:hypothetical protein